MTNLIEQAVADANAAYFAPLIPLMEFIEREDCVFVRQSDHVPLTRREIPESIKGERQDETSDWPDDHRLDDPRHNQAAGINAMRGGRDESR